MKKWLGVLASVGLLCVLATAVEAGTVIRWGETQAPDHIAPEDDRAGRQEGRAMPRRAESRSRAIPPASLAAPRI